MHIRAGDEGRDGDGGPRNRSARSSTHRNSPPAEGTRAPAKLVHFFTPFRTIEIAGAVANGRSFAPVLAAGPLPLLSMLKRLCL